MHLSPLIHDLAMILGLATVVTFIFRRIKQPVVLGYIIAGILVSPYTPIDFSITDLPHVQVWAELGVIFFMFALGLEFSFHKLTAVGVAASVTGMIEVSLMILLGFIGGKILGFDTTGCLFLGSMVAVSSTTIIIKTFEELGLKTRRFAQSIFGILIVEDLAAILLLVALSSVVTRVELNGLDIFIAAGKFALVVGAWFVIGMFIVPRFVKSVGKYGNDEMLTILSVGLCLILVVVSAYFHYSAALGAFMMGSILAETVEAERIEHLIRPLRDVFGAVFFVSVGMLINPQILLTHYATILFVTAIILIGKPLVITSASLLTGNTLADAIKIGFSMAQVGEFSFIIATLGVQYRVIDTSLYPIIVAASLITTFTTPYFIRFASHITAHQERYFPRMLLQVLDAYAAWFQQHELRISQNNFPFHLIFRWMINAVVATLCFAMVGQLMLPEMLLSFSDDSYALAVCWITAITISSPFIWGMFQTFAKYFHFQRDASSWLALHGTRLATVALIGLISLEFLPFWVALILSFLIASGIFLLLSKQMESYYDWFENQFKSSFKNQKSTESTSELFGHLAPWDAHLVSLAVHPNSPFVAKRLIELKLRERFGLNVVVIQRGDSTIVAPMANEIILPNDELLFLGTDEQLDAVRPSVEKGIEHEAEHENIGSYHLRQIEIGTSSPLVGLTVLKSGIRDKYQGIVVGVERDSRRIFNPKSDLVFMAEDILWVVGHHVGLQQLSEFSQSSGQT